MSQKNQPKTDKITINEKVDFSKTPIPVVYGTIEKIIQYLANNIGIPRDRVSTAIYIIGKSILSNEPVASTFITEDERTKSLTIFKDEHFNYRLNSAAVGKYKTHLLKTQSVFNQNIELNTLTSKEIYTLLDVISITLHGLATLKLFNKNITTVSTEEIFIYEERLKECRYELIYLTLDEILPRAILGKIFTQSEDTISLDSAKKSDTNSLISFLTEFYDTQISEYRSIQLIEKRF